MTGWCFGREYGTEDYERLMPLMCGRDGQAVSDGATRSTLGFDSLLEVIMTSNF